MVVKEGMARSGFFSLLLIHGHDILTGVRGSTVDVLHVKDNVTGRSTRSV